MFGHNKYRHTDKQGEEHQGGKGDGVVVGGGKVVAVQNTVSTDATFLSHIVR